VAGVFDFFQLAALAAHEQQHHCLDALRKNTAADAALDVCERVIEAR
jgi:hypothetical protein